MSKGIKLSEFITDTANKSHNCEIDDYDLTVDDILDKYCTPPLGGEYYFPDLFGKYGYTYTGICDGWEWYKDKLKNATEAEKWKMIALASLHWEHMYAKSEEKLLKEKYAFWIKDKNTTQSYHCSKCGRIVNTDEEKVNKEYPYCHCGCRMLPESLSLKEDMV